MVQSSATVLKSRWAVEVEGNNATILRLETFLAECLLNATDTFISRLREVPVVRSQLWDKISDTDLVSQLAQSELALLQGLTKLAGGASPLNVGTVFELGDAETIIRQTRQSLNSVYVLSTTSDTPAVFHQRMNAVRHHDALAGAAIELSGQPDWIKTYKAVEYLEEYYGGEKQLFAAFPNKKAALKRIKRTSQSVRHRARAFASINRPYKLEDAENFLQVLLKDIVAGIASPVLITGPIYAIPRREYPPDQVIGLKPLILVNGEKSEVAFVGDTLTAA